MTIRSCRDKRTSQFLAGKRVAEFAAFELQAMKAITKLQAVTRLVELRNPPSNRFESLGGDRKGQYSIRINDQWRVCFRWQVRDGEEGAEDLMAHGDPCDVEITDYH